jgi:DNA repair exonuclease SbcCD nuclease subunit
MPKFLHTADWQIGRLFATFDSEHAPLLAEARITAVERLAALATAQGVTAVLVAGDVFDAQTVSDRTVRRLFNALSGFAGPWLMIPGNHDAALAESVWTRAQRLGAVPANVHLCLMPEVRLFPELGFALLPAPLTQRHTYGDLTEWFDTAETPAGMLRIGLAHGCVQGILAEDIDSANPIAMDRPDCARLDYLALGDWHGTKIVGPKLAYSGTPEPDRFKANDSGQALLVDIPAVGIVPKITSVATAQFRWRSIAVELQVESDADLLMDQLQALQSNEVVDLTITGRISLALLNRLSAAIGRAEASARHLQTDLSGLQLVPSDDDIAGLQADGYLADVISELRTANATTDAEGANVAQYALALLAAELSNRPALTTTSGRVQP